MTWKIWLLIAAVLIHSEAFCEEALQLGKTFPDLNLEKNLKNYVGIKTSIKRTPIDLSLSGKKLELWTAEDSCGFRGCQFFIVEKKTRGQVQLMAEFFGQYKILESSNDSYRHIEVTTNMAGEVTKTVLKFRGDRYIAP